MDGAPKSIIKLEELVSSRDEGRHDLVAQEYEDAASNQGLPEANSKHQTDYDNNMGKPTADVLQWVKEVSAENVDLFLEDS